MLVQPKQILKTTRRTPIDSLVGNWIYYQYNGKQSDTNQTFHLVLKKTKQDTVVGYYCSTWNSGNRIDCSTENVNNIKGVFKKDTPLSLFLLVSMTTCKGETQKFIKQKKW